MLVHHEDHLAHIGRFNEINEVLLLLVQGIAIFSQHVELALAQPTLLVGDGHACCPLAVRALIQGGMV